MTLRPLFAWAMLAYAGAELFFVIFNWMLSDGTLSQRSQRADVTTVTSIALPILAVLLSTWVKPVLSIARTVALVAVAEYLVILIFGGATFTFGLVHLFDVAHGAVGALAVLSYVVFAALGFIFAVLCAVVAWRTYNGRTGFTDAIP
jgi:hypothetical protein